MKTANQYPVTTPYGKVAGYPLNNGFHNGIDYGCPTGTPVVINGVQIGLSGSTGYSTGPHLHVGRWVNGLPTNPKGGFTFKNAKVTEINEDKTNGKYVRVQADGASWVYLHLSKQTCKVGQTLKGEDMSITRGRAIRLLRLTRRGTDEKRIKALIGQDEDKWLDSVYKASWFKDQTAKISTNYQALKEKIIGFVKGA